MTHLPGIIYILEHIFISIYNFHTLKSRFLLCNAYIVNAMCLKSLAIYLKQCENDNHGKMEQRKLAAQSTTYKRDTWEEKRFRELG